MRGVAEGDRAPGDAALLQRELQVRAILADRAAIEDADPPREEARRRVADAVRREAVEPAQQLAVDGGKRQLRLDLEGRGQVVGGQALGGVGNEALARLWQARGVDAEAGGGAVAAVAQEEVVVAAQQRRDVEGVDRAARRASLAIDNLQRDGGPVVRLDEPRGDEADNALRDPLARDDQQRRGQLLGGEQRLGLFEGGDGVLAALTVEAVELGGGTARRRRPCYSLRERPRGRRRRCRESRDLLVDCPRDNARSPRARRPG